MYLIKVRFDSNVKGMYTEETMTATDKFHAESKYESLLNVWFEKLTGMLSCNISNLNHIEYSSCNMEPSERRLTERPDVESLIHLKNKLKLHIIQELISLGNSNIKEDEQERKFIITIEEIKQK